ncbi:arylmalonate decarboxylase [Aestuariivita sp.]|jgi:maleate isomerase|uniref:maleate cis-trans isomerase family protein n=1 Tax=Aestuariivita sp. TaxID=1872407 RepID=UPI00217025A2|nr:arylmalonate decarboxylase [Aestuariivita sp.]MCE8006094.1 arylmalonate decarboxylase [Aestuariivita sp.]
MFQSGQTIQSKPRTPEMGAGRHHRARLGFIMMSTDLAGEADFADMAPEGVGIHFTRLKTQDYTTTETLARHIDDMADAASRIQPDLKPDVISYSCTSGSIVCGEENVFREIRKGAPWAQPMCLVTGVIDALHELRAKRIVVGTPYLDDVNTAEAEFLLEKGFDVLDIQGLNLSTGTQMGQVTPAYWRKFALEIDQPEADVIFLSCGGVRSLEVVDEIEQAAGKPVITSNQAQFWSCLRRAGIMDELTGFGRIFQHPGRVLSKTDADTDR